MVDLEWDFRKEKVDLNQFIMQHASIMNINTNIRLLPILIVLLLPSLCLAWSGNVVGISDGDTITVMNDSRGEKIRLYGIDTPEKRQNFGTRAKQFTSGMVFGKIVEIETIDTDRYGRTVGIVHADGLNINQEIVRNGYAWVYTRYCKKPICNDWKGIETTARANKEGYLPCKKCNP